MSLFNRRKVITALTLTATLGACGFSPIYGTGTAASSLTGKIEVTSGKGRENFELRERLVERFGFNEHPKYKLNFTYDIDSTGLAISTTAEITRYNLVGTSAFKLTDTATGAVLISGTVKSSTAYSATSETFPTRTAEQDARSRIAVTLADQIVLRITSTAKQWVK